MTEFTPPYITSNLELNYLEHKTFDNLTINSKLVVSGSILATGSMQMTGSYYALGGGYYVDNVNVLDTALAYAIALG